MAQFSIVPVRVANVVRVRIGFVNRESSSWAKLTGKWRLGDHNVMIISRMEYEAVSRVARRNRERRKVFRGLKSESSRIISLE